MPVGNSNSLFQRRHFDYLAQVIRELGCVTEFQRRGIATELAHRLRTTNTAFNPERFIGAATDTGRTDRAPYVAPQVPEATRAGTGDGMPYAPERTCTDCERGEAYTPATYWCGSNPATREYLCDTHALIGACCRPMSELPANEPRSIN